MAPTSGAPNPCIYCAHLSCWCWGRTALGLNLAEPGRHGRRRRHAGHLSPAQLACGRRTRLPLLCAGGRKCIRRALASGRRPEPSGAPRGSVRGANGPRVEAPRERATIVRAGRASGGATRRALQSAGAAVRAPDAARPLAALGARRPANGQMGARTAATVASRGRRSPSAQGARRSGSARPQRTRARKWRPAAQNGRIAPSRAGASASPGLALALRPTT